MKHETQQKLHRKCCQKSFTININWQTKSIETRYIQYVLNKILTCKIVQFTKNSSLPNSTPVANSLNNNNNNCIPKSTRYIRNISRRCNLAQ